MKPKKLIFQCPYFYKCHAPQDMQPIPFLADKIEYEKRAIKCKHPFLKYYNEHICALAYDDGVDFDYELDDEELFEEIMDELSDIFDDEFDEDELYKIVIAILGNHFKEVEDFLMDIFEEIDD